MENIHFMWLSGMNAPDWRTVNYFRGKRLKEHFDSLFTQVVLLLQEEGFVFARAICGWNESGVLCEQVHVFERSVLTNSL